MLLFGFCDEWWIGAEPLFHPSAANPTRCPLLAPPSITIPNEKAGSTTPPAPCASDRSHPTRRKSEKATAPCRGPCADYRSRSRACNLKYCAFVCRAPPQLSVALNAFRSRQWKQTCHFRHGQGERHPHGYSTSFRASLVCCPEIFLNIIHHSQRPFPSVGNMVAAG